MQTCSQPLAKVYDPVKEEDLLLSLQQQGFGHRRRPWKARCCVHKLILSIGKRLQRTAIAVVLASASHC